MVTLPLLDWEINISLVFSAFNRQTQPSITIEDADFLVLLFSSLLYKNRCMLLWRRLSRSIKQLPSKICSSYYTQTLHIKYNNNQTINQTNKISNKLTKGGTATIKRSAITKTETWKPSAADVVSIVKYISDTKRHKLQSLLTLLHQSPWMIDPL